MNSPDRSSVPSTHHSEIVVVWVEILLSVRKVAVSNLGSKAAILRFVFLFLRPN